MPLKPWLASGLATTLAGCAYAYSSGEMGYVEHRSSPAMLWGEPGWSGAKLKEDRSASEQDCTKPVEKPTANLKCR